MFPRAPESCNTYRCHTRRHAHTHEYHQVSLNTISMRVGSRRQPKCPPYFKQPNVNVSRFAVHWAACRQTSWTARRPRRRHLPRSANSRHLPRHRVSGAGVPSLVPGSAEAGRPARLRSEKHEFSSSPRNHCPDGKLVLIQQSRSFHTKNTFHTKNRTVSLTCASQELPVRLAWSLTCGNGVDVVILVVGIFVLLRLGVARRDLQHLHLGRRAVWVVEIVRLRTVVRCKGIDSEGESAHRNTKESELLCRKRFRPASLIRFTEAK